MSRKSTYTAICCGIIAVAGIAGQRPARAQHPTGWVFSPNAVSDVYSPTANGAGTAVFWTNWRWTAPNAAHSLMSLAAVAGADLGSNVNASVQGVYYVSCSAHWVDLVTGAESSSPPTSGVSFNSGVMWMNDALAAASYTTTGGVWTANTGNASAQVSGALAGHGYMFATDNAIGLTGGLNATSPTPQPYGAALFTSSYSSGSTPPNTTASCTALRGRGGAAIIIGGVLKWGSNTDMGQGTYSEQVACPASYFLTSGSRFAYQQAPGANFNVSANAYNGSAAIASAYGTADLSAGTM